MPELIDARKAEQNKSLVTAHFTNLRQDNKLRTFRPSLKIRYLQSPTMPLPCHRYLKKTMISVVGTCIQLDWSHNVQTIDDHRHRPSPVTAIRKIRLPSYFVTTRPTSLPAPPCPAKSAKEQRNTP